MRRIRLEELLASPEAARDFGFLLGRGGLAAIPTDTFYGLAASPWQEPGVVRIFAAKGREGGKPLPVLAASEEQLDALGVQAPLVRDRLRRLWPAPLTAIVPISTALPASRGGRTLAVRIPDEERVRRLLERTGPLTATSANRSGLPPETDPDAVASALAGEIDVLVDGGRCPGGQPSTIVDFTVDPPQLRRAGAFAWPPRSEPTW